MTPQDEFNTVAEARLAKMAVEGLEKRFEEWTKQHDRNADERHSDLKASFDDVKHELHEFCRKCTGPAHSQQIFRITMWVSALTAAVGILYLLLGFDITKVIPK